MAWGIFRVVRRALTGEVIHKVDVDIENLGTISIRLKRRKDDLYVVMACLSSGNYQYYPMDMDQFKSVIQAMLAIKAVADPSKISD